MADGTSMDFLNRSLMSNLKLKNRNFHNACTHIYSVRLPHRADETLKGFLNRSLMSNLKLMSMNFRNAYNNICFFHFPRMVDGTLKGFLNRNLMSNWKLKNRNYRNVYNKLYPPFLSPCFYCIHYIPPQPIRQIIYSISLY